jgi:hypothetical protein
MSITGMNNVMKSGNMVSTGMTGAMGAMGGKSLSMGGMGSLQQWQGVQPMQFQMGQGGGGGMMGGGGGGGGLNAVLGIVQTLGGLWNSFQQHKIAREQLSLARETFETNLANQTQTYNTALEDRIRSRYHTEGREAGAADDYLSEHSL